MVVRLLNSVALVLIGTMALTAGEIGDGATASGNQQAPADYVIRPMDVVQIESLNSPIPKPYRPSVFDTLKIRVANALPDHPVDNYYMIEAEGVVDFGPPYGTVRAAGLTVKQISSAVDERLRKTIKEPKVSVELARIAGAQPICGQYLVEPNGTIDLKAYGLVRIAGKTAAQARAAVEDKLKEVYDSPTLLLQVAERNSGAYFPIAKTGGLFGKVLRKPLVGNETVLDAVKSSGWPVGKVRIVRLVPGARGYEQILPVDWGSIVHGSQTATNYRLVQGDRVIVEWREDDGRGCGSSSHLTGDCRKRLYDQSRPDF